MGGMMAATMGGSLAGGMGLLMGGAILVLVLPGIALIVAGVVLRLAGPFLEPGVGALRRNARMIQIVEAVPRALSLSFSMTWEISWP